MKAIKFKECNIVYAKNQPEYLQLPAHKTNDGIVTSRWRLSFLEWVKVIFTSRIYLKILTFNQPIQPVNISVNKEIKK